MIKESNEYHSCDVIKFLHVNQFEIKQALLQYPAKGHVHNQNVWGFFFKSTSKEDYWNIIKRKPSRLSHKVTTCWG